MGEKVVGLFGPSATPLDTAVSSETVEKLEEVLEAARSGQMRAVGISFMLQGHATRYWWWGSSHDLAVLVSSLHYRVMESIHRDLDSDTGWPDDAG